MDKRIKLTAKQLTLIKRMRELITKMKDEHLGIISWEGDLAFYNKANVIDKKYGWGIGDSTDDWYVEDGKVWIIPDYDELSESVVSINADITIDREDDWLSFAVEPSTKEEIEVLHEQQDGQKEYRRKCLQTTIAEYEAEKNKFLKKMEEALNSDGLPQKGKDYQKQLYTNRIKDMDSKIADAQKELAEL